MVTAKQKKAAEFDLLLFVFQIIPPITRHAWQKPRYRGNILEFTRFHAENEFSIGVPHRYNLHVYFLQY